MHIDVSRGKPECVVILALRNIIVVETESLGKLHVHYNYALDYNYATRCTTVTFSSRCRSRRASSRFVNRRSRPCATSRPGARPRALPQAQAERQCALCRRSIGVLWRRRVQ